MYKIQKSIDESSRIFQLRVVADVLIQHSHGWLRHQMSVKTKGKKNEYTKFQNICQKKTQSWCLENLFLKISPGRGWNLLVETDELRMGVYWIQGSVDHVH